jgi:hypothetical protein
MMTHPPADMLSIYSRQSSRPPSTRGDQAPDSCLPISNDDAASASGSSRTQSPAGELPLTNVEEGPVPDSDLTSPEGHKATLMSNAWEASERYRSSNNVLSCLTKKKPEDGKQGLPETICTAWDKRFRGCKPPEASRSLRGMRPTRLGKMRETQIDTS